MELKKTTIAIADDHRTTRSIISSFLSKSNFIVLFEVDNGEELIERIETTAMVPDVCIIDINMPRMDGFETTLRLKLQWPLIKVLAISGDQIPGQVLKIKLLGADGFIPKHCTIQELTNAITKLYK